MVVELDLVVTARTIAACITCKAIVSAHTIDGNAIPATNYTVFAPFSVTTAIQNFRPFLDDFAGYQVSY